MIYTNCIICNERAEIIKEQIAGYMEGMYFDIYHCHFCNTSFILPRVIEDKIYDYIYSQADTVPGYNRYALYAAEVKNKKNALDYLAGKEAMYFAIREIVSREADKTIKILEVGSGLGYLTYAISQQGFDITGLDISINAIDNARRNFGNNFIRQDVYNYSLDHESKFDMVILTEVIEHVPDPASFCRALMTLLKRKGKLVITTPNKSAYPDNELWYTELPPVHLSWFSEESFKKISEQNNLTVTFFDFSEFNKKHIDITKSKYYSRYVARHKITSTLSREGKVLFPKILTANNKSGILQIFLKSRFRKMVEPTLIRLFTHKNNSGRNNILCVILQQKV